MEVTVDKLLQIIGSQQVELMLARAELERLNKLVAEQTAEKKSETPPPHIRPVS